MTRFEHRVSEDYLRRVAYEDYEGAVLDIVPPPASLDSPELCAAPNGPNPPCPTVRRRQLDTACLRVEAALPLVNPVGKEAVMDIVVERCAAGPAPGWVLVDMAVAVADGATTISDVAVLADQADLFGSVASD